jgi:hypothetical protein
MNQKEFLLLAEVFRKHRRAYSNRTDSVALELLADIVRMLEENYTSFKKFRFYESLELTIEDVEALERRIN